MELNVLEQKKHRILFELRGADHTFCNALKQELWNDESVTAAAYSIRHPLLGVVEFLVESKADSKEAISEAVKRLLKRNKDFVAAFAKL